MVFTTAVLAMEQQGSVTFLISADGRQITEFTSFPTTPCVLDGVEYRFSRDRTSRFVMEGPVGQAAVADRFTTTEIVVTSPPRELVLRRAGRFRKRWDLYDGDQLRGTCRLAGFSATGDLPADLPLPLRVFVFYVAIMTRSGHLMGGASLWA